MCIIRFRTEQNEFLCSDNFKRHNVTMVAWNCDDTLVITAQSNFIIKVWNSDSAELIHELKVNTSIHLYIFT